MLGKPHPEQDQIGGRLRVARSMPPGRSLEVPGNRNPRGMIIILQGVTAAEDRTRLMGCFDIFP
jgi:hypothetical protein